MSQLKSYWANLMPRERSVISLAFIIVAALIFYLFIWEPWHKAINHYHKAVPQKRADLKWMLAHRDLAAKAGLGSVKKFKGANQGVLTLIESTASKAGLRKVIRQMSPGDNSSEARVWFTGVEFNKWLDWTGQLKTNQGIDVKSVNVQQAEEQGIVDIRATFSRS